MQVSNDFLQYWMGANARANQATTAPRSISAPTIVGQSPFTGTFSLTNQAFLPRFTPTSARCRWRRSRSSPPRRRTSCRAPPNAVGVSTEDTQLWGFGLENIADRATRATLIREGLGPLGVNPYTQTTGGRGRPVPATLSLTLGAPASFGAFTPGVDARVHGVHRPPTSSRRRATRR